MDIDKYLSFLSINNALREEQITRLLPAIERAGIQIKEGDNLRNMTNIMNDLSNKWQELEGSENNV